MFFIQKCLKYAYVYIVNNKVNFFSLFFYFSFKFPVIPVVINHNLTFTKFIWKKRASNDNKVFKGVFKFPVNFYLTLPVSDGSYLHFFFKNYSNYNPVSFNLSKNSSVIGVKHNTSLIYFWSALKTQILTQKYLFNLSYWVLHSSSLLFFFNKKKKLTCDQPALSYNLRYNYTFNLLNLNNKLV